MFAVIPGISFLSGLGAFTITVYVTTFDVTSGCNLISLKYFRRKSIDSKINWLSLFDLTNICLVHSSLNVHLRKVIRYREKVGCTETGCYRLTLIHGPVKYNTEDW